MRKYINKHCVKHGNLGNAMVKTWQVGDLKVHANFQSKVHAAGASRTLSVHEKLLYPMIHAHGSPLQILRYPVRPQHLVQLPNRF